MSSVVQMPVRLKHEICREQNGAQYVDLNELQCPRVGECLCMSTRQVLTRNLERARVALEQHQED